jgi:high-affinity iron transporter
MFSSILITFRETLEAALVIGIVLTFLTRTNQNIFKKFVWRGVGVGVGISIVLAFLLEAFFGGFEGRTEEIFEGILMFVTVGFLTWMIMWVHKQKDVAKRLKEKVALHAKEGYGLGVFILTVTAVSREGVETVLYLKASSVAGASNQLAGAVIGVLAALALGYALFRLAIKVNLSLVFNVISVFLLLFAAGLLAHGVHEFQEAGLLPIFSFDPVFNISHVLDHSSIFGSFLRVVFGYTSRPTFLELISYSAYFVFIFWFQKIADRALVKRIL